MKKILLFLFGVIASLSAMAATGNYFISGSFNGWDHAKLQFQQTGTTYSITLDGTGLQPFSGEFLICGGTLGTPDWTDKIGGVSNIEPDKTYTYTVGGGNFSVKGVIAYPLTVTFNTSDKTIKITGAAAENEYSTVYVVGDFGDAWDESRTDGPLTLKSGTNNVWEGDVTFTGASNYFKLKAGAYIYGTGGADIEVEMGESYTASQSGNAFNVGSGTYHFNFVLDKNAPTGVLTVTGNGNPPTPPTPPTPGDYTGWYFNLGSPANEAAGNEWFTGVAVPEDGIVEYGDIALGNDLFKIKIWNGTDDLYYGTADGMVEPNTPTVLTEVTVMEEMHVTGAVAGSVYNVKYDCGTNTLTLTKVGDDPNPPTPPTPGDYTGWYFNLGSPANEAAGNE
ncbi:MAG: hypothetical protein K2G67_05835, partial [Muribaculaceae bacterium]|nr:hypothetical protein [Muribaculaceae bacterium]